MPNLLTSLLTLLACSACDPSCWDSLVICPAEHERCRAAGLVLVEVPGLGYKVRVRVRVRVRVGLKVGVSGQWEGEVGVGLGQGFLGSTFRAWARVRGMGYA